eukprot:4446695-Amphidinium_carterae.1
MSSSIPATFAFRSQPMKILPAPDTAVIASIMCCSNARCASCESSSVGACALMTCKTRRLTRTVTRKTRGEWASCSSTSTPFLSLTITIKPPRCVSAGEVQRRYSPILSSCRVSRSRVSWMHTMSASMAKNCFAANISLPGSRRLRAFSEVRLSRNSFPPSLSLFLELFCLSARCPQQRCTAASSGEGVSAKV